MTKEKVIIGRKEVAEFPQLSKSPINVKIDTGAYTSSIHCESIEEQENSRVLCVFLDKNTEGYTGQELEFDIVRKTIVKSSNGLAEKRLMIQTTIILLEREYNIYLTLTDRADMKFPVLIGRKFLAKKFIVDVTLKNQNNIKIP